MFTNVIMTLIKNMLRFNIITILIVMILNLSKHFMFKVTYACLSKAFSLHPQPWCAGNSSHLPINLLVAISKSNVSFDFDNIIFFHQFATSFKLFTYIFPEPFHTTTQTSQNNAGVFFTRYCSLFFLNF